MSLLTRRDRFETAVLYFVWLAIGASIILLGHAAFAQTVLTDSSTAAAPSAFSTFLAQWLTPGGVVSVLALVLSAIGGFSWLTGKRKRLLATAFFHGYHLVEDIGNELEGEDGFDKTARYLKEVDGWLLKNGWRPLQPGEVELAKLQASSLRGPIAVGFGSLPVRFFTRAS